MSTGGIGLLEDHTVDVAGIIDFELSLDDIDDAFRRAMRPEVVKARTASR